MCVKEIVLMYWIYVLRGVRLLLRFRGEREKGDDKESFRNSLSFVFSFQILSFESSFPFLRQVLPSVARKVEVNGVLRVERRLDVNFSLSKFLVAKLSRREAEFELQINTCQK